ncbi:MAG TPA: hypothetical protein VGR56_02675 [Nitrososphaerales archaeon]|nr:hypothetical protein [Nitrososphaerales archaeon]
MNGATRPDVLIVQEPAFGRKSSAGQFAIQALYDQLYVIECKIDPEDLKNSPYQLIMALHTFTGQGSFDLHHGGVRPLVAIPPALVATLKRRREFSILFRILKELNFGLFVIDRRSRRFRIISFPGSFLGR